LEILDACAEHEDPACRKDAEPHRSVRLLERVVDALLVGGVHAAKKANLRGLAPSTKHRQLATTFEHPRRDEFDFRPLVTRDRIAGARVDVVVRADGGGAAGAERESAARVRALEVRMPLEGGA
jgi:hypothetical protein